MKKPVPLAEAALQLNRVFEAADKAAQQYLENVRLMSEKGKRRVMKSKSWKSPEPPTLEQLEAELGREKYKRRYKRVLRSTVYTLVVVAAVAVLVGYHLDARAADLRVFHDAHAE